MIADGTLVGGQQLRQDELATRLGISRSPVREAIAWLQAEGLAVVERNRGLQQVDPAFSESQPSRYDQRFRLAEPRAVAALARRSSAWRRQVASSH